MAKRMTEAELDKRRQRRILIFSIFMIGLMVLSTFAYYISSAPDSQNQMVYGEYEFTYRDFGNGAGALITEIDGQEVEFQNLPIQVTYMNVSPEAIALLKNAGQVALAAPTNISIQDASLIDYARLEFGLAIPKAFNAMTDDDPRYTLPVLTCVEATPQLPVVVFNATNETASVTTSGSCIIVNGNGRDLMRLKDRMIFEYVGIMEDGVIVDD